MWKSIRPLVGLGIFALLPGCDRADIQVATAEVRQNQVVEIDWRAVEEAMGRPGAQQESGEYRFNMPRADLQVTVDGVRIRPALSLGSWVAFLPSGGSEAVLMGDLVLTQEELNPVLTRLHEGGIGQTAIHKHLPEHSPGLWWTHVHGHGDPVRLARTVREAIALTATPAAAATPPASPPLDLDTAQIRQILGRGGNSNGGVYNVTFARAETIRSGGVEVPPSMGMATVLNFQPLGGGRAVINGDFSMLPAEVDRVVRQLRTHGIDVVSIHNHTTDEDPRLVFTHFWGNGDAATLARGLRAALDETNVRR